MIAGLGQWRLLAVVVLVVIPLGMTGIVSHQANQQQAEITGTIDSTLGQHTVVTVSANGTSEPVWVSGATHQPLYTPPYWQQVGPLTASGERATVPFSLRVSAPGEYTIEIEAVNRPRPHHHRRLPEAHRQHLRNITDLDAFVGIYPERWALYHLSRPPAHFSERGIPVTDGDENLRGVPDNGSRTVLSGGRMIGQPIAENYTITVEEGEVVENLRFVLIRETDFGTGGGSIPKSEIEFPDDGPEGGIGFAFPRRPLMIVIIASLIALLAIQYLRTGSDAHVPNGGHDEDGSQAGQAMGRLAGEAADRIEQASSVDNEVYRAWFDMTQVLAVPNKETVTPGEFERAAVEAGLPEDAVTELTTLFNEVRYGGDDPDIHTERAVAVLREIEAATSGEERQ